MRICIDFDGVLHDAANPVPGWRMGRPILGSKLAVMSLVHAGHKIIIHSARCHQEYSLPHVKAWLRFYEFPELDISIPKPRADVYIDDKAVRFTDWDHALSAISYINAGLASEHGSSHPQEPKRIDPARVHRSRDGDTDPHW